MNLFLLAALDFYYVTHCAQLRHVVFINTSASAMVTFIIYIKENSMYVNTQPVTSRVNIKVNRENGIHVHDRHQPSFLAIPIISLDGQG